MCERTLTLKNEIRRIHNARQCAKARGPTETTRIACAPPAGPRAQVNNRIHRVHTSITVGKASERDDDGGASRAACLVHGDVADRGLEGSGRADDDADERDGEGTARPQATGRRTWRRLTAQREKVGCGPEGDMGGPMCSGALTAVHAWSGI